VSGKNRSPISEVAAKQSRQRKGDAAPGKKHKHRGKSAAKSSKKSAKKPLKAKKKSRR
jgi:hypothetical protein